MCLSIQWRQKGQPAGGVRGKSHQIHPQGTMNACTKSVGLTDHA